MRIAIIGAGKMGVWFANLFLKEGYSVVVASRNKEKLLKLKKELSIEIADFGEAVQNADRVLICVSISAFESVVKTIGSSIRRPGCYGYLLNQRLPGRRHASAHKEWFGFGYTSRFWSWKQKR